MEVKPLKYQELEGISKRQLAEHHDVLYAGYVKKYNEIIEKLDHVDYTTANATYSEVRALQQEKSFALNGIKLHEYYFDNMTDSPKPIDSSCSEQISKEWGSFEKWSAQFTALGMAARGWVVLARNLSNGKLDNYIFDAHNQGGVADTELILVMDVYEHAYFIDYGTARKDYIAKFMDAIDWVVVANRLKKKSKLNI